MAKIRLTKGVLREQQYRLGQLSRYLPTLELKKAMLQFERQETIYQIEKFEGVYSENRSEVERLASLLAARESDWLLPFLAIEQVKRREENIAGVDVPIFEEVIFVEINYSLLDTPLWFDQVLTKLRELFELQEQIKTVKEKKRRLEEELRSVTIRVNLFEKRLIPQAQEGIKKIKIYLGDQDLAAVAQAKVAKRKISR